MDNKELFGQEEERLPESIPEETAEAAIPESPAADASSDAVADEIPVIVELPMDSHSEGFKLITRIQDEAHRFAIEYHRSLRS